MPEGKWHETDRVWCGNWRGGMQDKAVVQYTASKLSQLGSTSNKRPCAALIWLKITKALHRCYKLRTEKQQDVHLTHIATCITGQHASSHHVCKAAGHTVPISSELDFLVWRDVAEKPLRPSSSSGWWNNNNNHRYHHLILSTWPYWHQHQAVISLLVFLLTSRSWILAVITSQIKKKCNM